MERITRPPGPTRPNSLCHSLCLARWPIFYTNSVLPSSPRPGDYPRLCPNPLANSLQNRLKTKRMLAILLVYLLLLLILAAISWIVIPMLVETDFLLHCRHPALVEAPPKSGGHSVYHRHLYFQWDADPQPSVHQYPDPLQPVDRYYLWAVNPCSRFLHLADLYSGDLNLSGKRWSTGGRLDQASRTARLSGRL